MDFMTQTSRTMLLTQVNASMDIPKLSTQLADVNENLAGLDDTKKKRIVDALTVGSFDEFVDTFKPTIYASYGIMAQKNDEGEFIEDPSADLEVHYSINEDDYKGQPFIEKTVLDKNHLVVKMLIKTINDKAGSKKQDIDYDFKALLAELAPRKEVEAAKRIKDNLNQLHKLYGALEDEHPQKAEYATLVNEQFEKTRPYQENPAKLIALAAAAAELKLEQFARNAPSEGADGAPKGTFLSRPLAMSDAGARAGKIEIKMPAGAIGIEAKDAAPALEEGAAPSGEASTALSAITDAPKDAQPTPKKTESLKDLLMVDYERTKKAIDEKNENSTKIMAQESQAEHEKVKLQLLADVFLDEVDEDQAEKDQENPQRVVDRYNSYMDLHAKSQQRLMNVAKPLLETLMGVYLFFQQSAGPRYGGKDKKLTPKLLVSNNTYDDLFSDESITKKVEVFLNNVNSTMHDDAVWFAIIPGLQYEATGDGAEGYTGPLTVEKKEDPNKPPPVTSGQMKGYVDLFTRLRIQAFFSFETANVTSFLGLQENGITPFMEKLENLRGERYAIPCMPNYSLIPDVAGKTVFGKTYEITASNTVKIKGKVEDKIQWLPGIGVPACYIAAGMVAAWQIPKWLEFKIGEANQKANMYVSKELPGVRVNIESDNLALVLTTTLGRSVYGIADELATQINTEAAGFVFSSNRRFLQGAPVELLTVQIARCMRETGDGKFEPFYCALAERMIQRNIYRLTLFEADQLDQFFNGGPRVNVVAKWGELSKHASGKNYVNALVRTGDNLTYEKDEESVSIQFVGNPEFYNIEVSAITS